MASLKHVVRSAVWAHFVFSELPDGGTRTLAGELVHSFIFPAEFDAGGRSYEMHLPARFAHDSHVDSHFEDYGTI